MRYELPLALFFSLITHPTRERSVLLSSFRGRDNGHLARYTLRFSSFSFHCRSMRSSFVSQSKPRPSSLFRLVTVKRISATHPYPADKRAKTGTFLVPQRHIAICVGACTSARALKLSTPTSSSSWTAEVSSSWPAAPSRPAPPAGVASSLLSVRPWHIFGVARPRNALCVFDATFNLYYSRELVGTWS